LYFIEISTTYFTDIIHSLAIERLHKDMACICECESTLLKISLLGKSAAAKEFTYFAAVLHSTLEDTSLLSYTKAPFGPLHYCSNQSISHVKIGIGRLARHGLA